ncbi:MAG: GNAT family N-acetyltransferase [Arthrobacter sp.]
MMFEFRPVDPVADAPLLHSWMSLDYAHFWGMGSASLDEVRREYAGIDANPHHEAWLGLHGDAPAFLMESYAPAHSPLAALYPVQPGDRGMHLLMSPPDNPRHGFTFAAFRAVMDFLFSAPQAGQAPQPQRIVVEPDVRNSKIHVLNQRLGFQPHSRIELPDKTALLSFCTRQQFLAATAGTRMTYEGAKR